MDVNQLVENIKFEQPWEELNDNQKADFLKLMSYSCLHETMKERIVKEYDEFRHIVEHRGLSSLKYYV